MVVALQNPEFYADKFKGVEEMHPSNMPFVAQLSLSLMMAYY